MLFVPASVLGSNPLIDFELFLHSLNYLPMMLSECMTVFSPFYLSNSDMMCGREPCLRYQPKVLSELIRWINCSEKTRQKYTLTKIYIMNGLNQNMLFVRNQKQFGSIPGHIWSMFVTCLRHFLNCLTLVLLNIG